MNLARQTALEILEQMLLMRRFEETVIQLSTEEKYFFGHFHVYTGQEATGAPVIAQLRGDDLITTTHRNHGHIVGRGGHAGRALAEIMGRARGYNGGRGGTLHLCARELGFLSTSAVVGGSVGLGLGAAYTLKNTKGDALAVSFFGDGAVEEGIVFESLNMAQLYKLPILFLCENNSRGAPGASAGEYPSSEMAAKQLIDISNSLGMRSEVVDGGDVNAVYDLIGDVSEYIRSGRGPVFVEALTERWPGTRPLWPALLTGVTDITHAWNQESIEGEHADWIKNHDPILRFVRELSTSGEVDKDEILAIDKKVLEGMKKSRDFATSSPFPDPSTALDDVFA